MKKPVAILAIAVGCMSFSGCVSNPGRLLDAAQDVPYQTYAGSPLSAEQTASLMLLTETSAPSGGATTGWVRVLEIDDLDVSKVKSTWAQVVPGRHHFKTICRAGRLHGGVREWTAVFAANMSYVWEVNRVDGESNTPECQPALEQTAGVDKNPLVHHAAG